tara:strand:+ start:31281 stop:31658 length:378 start_codon:yes stop_codon:yes gene_type:complete
MLRPLDDGLAPVSSEERQSWLHDIPVDASGCPTSDKSEGLLRLFFENPDSLFELELLAEDVMIRPLELRSRLRVMTALNLIEEYPVNSLVFRRAQRIWNRQLFESVSQHVRADSPIDSAHVRPAA